jgi:hypothetical protein
MGDRGNIFCTEGDKDQNGSPRGIYMYTHWRGYRLPLILREALRKGQSRWDDPAYLNRVIFQTLLGNDTDVTGYGLSLHIPDNERPILEVDLRAQRVTCKGKSWSYSDYILLDDPIKELYGSSQYPEDE